VAFAYLDPIGLQIRLGVAQPAEDLFRRLTPYLAVTVALALAIGCFLLIAHRVSHASRVVLVMVLAGADLGVYMANASYATVPSAALAGSTPASSRLAQLTAGGRFALYDPLDIAATAHYSPLDVGKQDLNLLHQVPSIQGYGSIVSGVYQDDTNTHSLGDLNPAVLRNGLANELDTRVFLTLPVYLDEGLPPNGPIPVAGVAPVAARDSSSPLSTPPPAPLASGPWIVDANNHNEWLLPSVSALRRVTIVVNHTTPQMPRSIDVALELPGQAAHFVSVPVVNGEAVFASRTPHPAEAVVIGNPGSAAVTIGAVVVVTQNPDDRFLLDGALQGSLVVPQWQYEGQLGPYTVFLNHDADGTAWLQAASSREVARSQPAIGTVVPTSKSMSGEEKMSVLADRPALLVRSVAFEPGSTATLTPVGGGQSRSLVVKRLGLIEAVQVPAGHYQVTWSYAPRSVVVGALLSLGSVLLAALLAVLVVFDRRRRRRAAASAGLGPVL